MKTKTLELPTEIVEVTRANSGIVKDVLTNGCYHCRSTQVKHNKKENSVICEICGCIHTEDGWEYKIPVSSFDASSVSSWTWTPEDKNLN